MSARVYFIAGGPGDKPGTVLVKVGHTSQATESRLKQLQTGSAQPLRVVCEFFVKDKSTAALGERWFKRVFTEGGCHVAGEWFLFKERLVRDLEQIRRDAKLRGEVPFGS